MTTNTDTLALLREVVDAYRSGSRIRLGAAIDKAYDAIAALEAAPEGDGLRKLAAFGLACLGAARGDDYLCGELDGGDVQDAAEKHGVLVPVPVTEACGENCACAEWDGFPQDCYQMPTDVRAAATAIAAPQPKEPTGDKSRE